MANLNYDQYNYGKWIGANDIDDDGSWIWVDDSGTNQGLNINDGSTFFKWHVQVNPEENPNKNCATIGQSGVPWAILWWDWNCDDKRNGFICEKRFYD